MCGTKNNNNMLYYRFIKNSAAIIAQARFIHLLVDPSVLLGQLGDVTPAACPGSSQQAEHETRPKGNRQGPCQPAHVHTRANIYMRS